MLLTLLYWIILILSVVGVFAPPSWPYAPRISGLSWVILFVIIGLKIFRTSI